MRFPTVSTRLTSQLITNPEQRRVASTLVTGWPSIHETGFVYSLFQRNIAAGAGGPKNIDYMLNRSTDGGATWTLNGMAGGIIVANADSTQPTPKFGTVNALLGGVDHAACRSK